MDSRIYFKLGQIAAEPEMRGASISAMYALGASRTYGEQPDWFTLPMEQRDIVLEALKDFPDALAVLDPHKEEIDA